MSAPKLWFEWQNRFGDFHYREATPDEIRAAYAALEPEEPLKYSWRDMKAGDRVWCGSNCLLVVGHDAEEDLEWIEEVTLIERGGYNAWRTVKPGETK